MQLNFVPLKFPPLKLSLQVYFGIKEETEDSFAHTPKQGPSVSPCRIFPGTYSEENNLCTWFNIYK